ncbi:MULTISPECIES: hypothetical protein [unclassified Streptomyces]|uniref:hypothetical protein n=1 Tax=unclassified Streptomyces TaxID=2593676 RepID=UPI0008047E1D|nr:MULTISPECIES: hypothetical protein [unclassified Streptomyces]MYR75103.1 hypothetical protein [Streptomyces sp. SID4925]SBU97937.1 hypothetical protein YUMDRAFT_05973 [Streptomyces sp. OspMP-M45]
MTEPQSAQSVCDHAYEVRMLGGHPLSVRLCALCRTPDWRDLYEQADALFRWGREEGLAGRPPRVTISAYDQPTEREPELPDTGVRTRVAALHAPVQHMGQAWCGECSVRRSTGPAAEEWVAFIPHPCPTIDALNGTEATA